MDHFTTNWSKKIQQDPTANLLLNNTTRVLKWRTYQPENVTWSDPNDITNYNVRINYNNGRWDYASNSKDITQPIKVSQEKFGFMTREEFDRHIGTNIVLEGAQPNQEYEINKQEEEIGYLIGQRRRREQQPIRTSLIGRDEHERYLMRNHNKLNSPSFWANTAPQLYNLTNKHIRSNPFQAISKTPLKISTPLITFSD